MALNGNVRVADHPAAIHETPKAGQDQFSRSTVVANGHSTSGLTVTQEESGPLMLR
jgi:hypothetical protein